MAITRVDATEAQSSSAEASRSVTLSASVAEGDQLILIGVSTSANAFASLSGWTALAEFSVTSAACRIAVWRRTAQTGDASASVTPTLSSGTAMLAVQALVYRGVDTTTPIDATTQTADSGGVTGTSVTAPAITTVTDAAEIVTVHALPTSGGTTMAEADWTAPAGMGDELVTCSTDGFATNACVASYDITTSAAGSYGSYAATSSQTRRWGAVTVALRPASTAIARITETDTAQAVSALRTYTAGQVAETDTAQALTASQVWEIGRATETDTAQAVSFSTSASGMVQFPQVRVEVAFSSGASTGTLLHLDDPTRGLLDTGTLGDGSVDVPIWTDVTPYANPGPIATDRNAARADSPLIEYETGRMSVVLANDDRRFDPSNLAGPYVSGGVTQLTARRAVRVLATWSDVTYEVFRGFADSWHVTWHDPDDSTCTLSASDGFSVLSGIDRPAVPAVGASEDSGARIARILDGAGWPADDRDIATGDSTLQATTLEGGALGEMQQVAASEIGELYCDGGGRIVFRNRNGILQDARSNTSQATFGDNDGELPYVDVDWATDATTFFNTVRATRAGGAEQLVEDAASQAVYYPKTYVPPSEVLLETDADTANYASWLLHVASDPELRFTKLVVDPRYQPAELYPQVLGRELGDRITVIRRPPGGGDPIEQEVFIRGIEHHIADNEWTTTWTLQQASKYGSFLTLDNLTLGVLGSNALAY